MDEVHRACMREVSVARAAVEDAAAWGISDLRSASDLLIGWAFWTTHTLWSPHVLDRLRINCSRNRSRSRGFAVTPALGVGLFEEALGLGELLDPEHDTAAVPDLLGELEPLDALREEVAEALTPADQPAPLDRGAAGLPPG